MDAYVSKPIRGDELFEAIDALVPPDATSIISEATCIDTHECLDADALLRSVDGNRKLLKEIAGLFVDQQDAIRNGTVSGPGDLEGDPGCGAPARADGTLRTNRNDSRRHQDLSSVVLPVRPVYQRARGAWLYVTGLIRGRKYPGVEFSLMIRCKD